MKKLISQKPSLIFADKLEGKGGSKVETASLDYKIVAIYFSAHWCPPCQVNCYSTILSLYLSK